MRKLISVFGCSVLFASMWLSGCVVTSGSSLGTIDVKWTTNLCNSLNLSSVRVRVVSGSSTTVETDAQCSAGTASVAVREGTYQVQVLGIASGTIAAESGIESITVRGGTTQTTGVLVLEPLSAAIAVGWTIQGQSAVAGCPSQGLQAVVVSVVDASQTQVLATVQVQCSAGQATVLKVPPGSHFVQIDALDASGALVFGNSPLTGPVVVNAGETVALVDLVDLIPLASAGGLNLGWTLYGEAPGSACAKQSVQTVTVTVLDETQTKTVATSQVACSQGSATMKGLPSGKYYIQLDGLSIKQQYTFGNKQLAGPVNYGGGSMSLPTAIDMVDLRTSVSLDWSFDDGGSCSSKNVAHVLIEVRNDKDAVIVPMSAADAKKPCVIGPNSAVEARVIDMKYAEPTCSIPPGAKGLIICNIEGPSIGVTVSTVDPSGTKITHGGSMTIKEIPATTHTALPTPLVLAPCSSANPCAQP